MDLETLTKILDQLKDYGKRIKQLESAQGEPTLFENRLKFIPPTKDEVKIYCNAEHKSVDAVVWWNFYNAKGWQIGKNKMKNWKSAVATWDKTYEPKQTNPSPMPNQVNRIEETKDYINKVESNTENCVPMPESLRKRIKRIGLD